MNGGGEDVETPSGSIADNGGGLKVNRLRNLQVLH